MSVFEVDRAQVQQHRHEPMHLHKRGHNTLQRLISLLSLVSFSVMFTRVSFGQEFSPVKNKPADDGSVVKDSPTSARQFIFEVPPGVGHSYPRGEFTPRYEIAQ